MWTCSHLSWHCFWICVISAHREWSVIKVLRFRLHVIALTICRVRCFLTAGCAVTCAHQAYLCLLGCLISTLIAIGGRVQASPDHCSQSWVSGTDRRNRNHINPDRTKRKAYIHSKQKQENLTVSPRSTAACVSSAHCCLLVLPWRPSATHTSFQRAVEKPLVRTLGRGCKTPCGRWPGLTSLDRRKNK